MNLEEEVIDYFLTMFPGFVIKTENKEFTNKLENMSEKEVAELLKQLTDESFNNVKTVNYKKCQKYLQLYRELQKIFKKPLDN